MTFSAQRRFWFWNSNCLLSFVFGFEDLCSFLFGLVLCQWPVSVCCLYKIKHDSNFKRLVFVFFLFVRGRDFDSKLWLTVTNSLHLIFVMQLSYEDSSKRIQ